MSRIILTVAATAAVLAFAPLSAEAAMPVSGAPQAGVGSNIVLAQAPPAAQDPAAAQQPAKKQAKKKSARQEAEESAQSGTVPKRYMQNVPKEYHHLIPFSK